MISFSLLALSTALQPYGPDTCKTGYVWREASPDDHVCVIPERRTQARRDNAQAKYRVSKIQTYGPHTCRTGYVWREAFDGDVVCVTPQVREQTRQDNALAADRYVNE